MGESLLSSPGGAAERAAQLVDDWRANRAPVLLMGKNAFADIVADFAGRNGLHIAGIIASDLTEATWRGFPRRALSDLPPNAVVVNCVPDGRTITIQKQILRANLLPLTYFELSAWSPVDFPLDFLTPPFTAKDEAALTWVMERLADAYSRDTLRRIVRFRSSYDVAPLAMFPFDIENQYVESFVREKSYSHLIDGGAYDGKSTNTLIGAYESLRSATVLEPNRAMHGSIHRTLAGRNYELIEKGLWSSTGMLRFSGSHGPASRIDEVDGESIDVTCIDDLPVEDNTLIKLDVEGAEMEALRGARRTIVSRRPGLAIAAYHDNRHFHEIPQFVLGLQPDYRMRLRHYTEGRLETIYYFV